MLDYIRLLDREITESLNFWALSSPATKFLVIFCARYLILLPILAYVYLFLKKRLNAIIVGFAGVALAFFIDYLFALVRFRERPFVVHESIVHLDEKIGLTSSFPSSHTAAAFALATAIYLYGHRRLGPALFIVALFIAFGRVAAGVHYPTDVVGGMIVGIIAGKIAHTFIEYALKEHHKNHGKE